MAEHEGKRAAPPPPDGIKATSAARGPQGDRLAGIAATLNAAAPVQRAANKTGLPDRLKSGVEALSGMSLDHVRVHRGSDKPAQLGAHAYALGADIHLASGQERHLPHEAWHVVQQAQGRVKPTMQLKAGVPVNDDRGLEAEAEVMGAKALSAGGSASAPPVQRQVGSPGDVVQRVVWQAGNDLQWHPFIDNSNRPPMHAPTAPGELYDDSSGKTYADVFAFYARGHDGGDDEEYVQAMDESDDDEKQYESADDEDEEVFDHRVPTRELSIEERKSIERKAKQRPFETSLLKPGTKYPSRQVETKEKFGKGKKQQRTVKSGAVKIALETVMIYQQDKLVSRDRPIRVEGLIEPTVTTGRPQAPDPISGKQIYFPTKEPKDGKKVKRPALSIDTERNSGMTDGERGHIMALELGGPDIPANIVPQWAKFQGNDSWRKMEVAVLKKAKELPRGERMNYIVEVFYKSSGDITPTLNSFAVPTGFKVITEVFDEKGNAGEQTVEFLQGQSHDDTDEKLRDRKFAKIDGDDDDKAISLAPPSKPRAPRKTPTPDERKAAKLKRQLATKKKLDKMLSVKVPRTKKSATEKRKTVKKIVDKTALKTVNKTVPNSSVVKRGRGRPRKNP